MIHTDELGRSFDLPINTPTPTATLTSHLNSLSTLTTLLNTSIGPNGLDKVILGKDDDLTVTNDGATILKFLENKDAISRIVVQLSEAIDEEIGDGTTSVVLLAGALLREAAKIVEKGAHPISVCNAFENALCKVVDHLISISTDFSKIQQSDELNNCDMPSILGDAKIRGDDKQDENVIQSESQESIEVQNINTNILKTLSSMKIKAAKTSLNSKIVNKALEKFAAVCVEAIESVIERNDVDFEKIYIESKIGKDLNETKFVQGILIDKEMSHPQMKKEFKDAKVALLSCPFEPPKLKTKSDLLIQNVEDFKKLEMYEKKVFRKMIEDLKRVGAEIVLCQWGFDHEANSLLLKSGIGAVRWVGGNDMEKIAVYLDAKIVARFEDLRADDLGRCSLKEVSLGGSEKMIVIEGKRKAGMRFVRFVTFALIHGLFLEAEVQI
jgi:T-complex protein 1 subunit epsilon